MFLRLLDEISLRFLKVLFVFIACEPIILDSEISHAEKANSISSPTTSDPKLEELNTEKKPTRSFIRSSKDSARQDSPEIPVNIGRLSDTLVALLPGALIHGAGHWYRGDLKSSQRILFLEGASLLALLSAYSMEHSLDQEKAFNRSSTQWFYHIGGVLFVTTWLADIIGAFRGDQFQKEALVKGIKSQFSSGYRYQNDPQRSFNHHLIAQLELSYQRWALNLGLDWESNAKLAGLHATVQNRTFNYLPNGSLQPSSIHLGLFTKRWVWLQEGLTQWLVAPFIYGELSLDLLSKGLKSFSLFHKFSVAWEQYTLAPISSLPNSDETIYSFPMILDSGLIFNLSRNFMFSFSIMQDRTLDIRPLNEDHFFWRSEIKVRQSEKLDLNAKFIVGDDWSMWLTLNFQLGQKS